VVVPETGRELLIQVLERFQLLVPAAELFQVKVSANAGAQANSAAATLIAAR
jgi:hypothetical protein